MTLKAPRLEGDLMPRLRQWTPALLGGALSLVVFLFPGETPLLRACGMALVIVAMAMSLRRFGAALALCGCLVLAFSPAFWTQTGGASRQDLLPLLALATLAALVALLLLRRQGSLLLAAVVALALFSLVFWWQQGQTESLRLTALASAWLLVLLLDLLQRALPHPDDAGVREPEASHAWAILILLVIGIVNTRLFVLFVPAVCSALILSKVRLSRLFWPIFLLACLFGLSGIVSRYLSSEWWLYPAAQAMEEGLVLPWLLADGWREAARWLTLLETVRDQLSIPGSLLALFGLSRLSRWYPATGIVTLLAWGCWALFGLVYFGRDIAVLLLPLHMIGIIWMTVAVHAIRDWSGRLAQGSAFRPGWAVTGIYALLPLWLLLQHL